MIWGVMNWLEKALISFSILSEVFTC
jgi:hypothetical protein